MGKFIFLKSFAMLFLFISFFQPLWGQNREPQLRLSTEMHAARIMDMAQWNNGQLLLTCSDDKTAKLWDGQTGRLIRTYRIPIDEGNLGKLYACAISPDGKDVALGGWNYYGESDQYMMYIMDLDSGELRHSLVVSGTVHGLDYSEDGSYLAAGGAWGDLRIFETSAYNEIAKLENNGNHIYSVDFSSDGLLAVTETKSFIHIYDSRFELIKTINLTAATNPFHVCFSPDGNRLALGYSDTERIQVFSTKTGKLLYEPSTEGVNEGYNINSLCWSKDGEFLYGGGSHNIYIDDNWYYPVRRWADGGRGDFVDLAAARDTVISVIVLDQGDIFFSSTAPDWGRLDSQGNRKLSLESNIQTLALRDRSHLITDERGQNIGFKPLNSDPLSFSLQNMELSNQEAQGHTFQDSAGSTSITDWNGTMEPKVNGRNINVLEWGETSRSVSIHPSRDPIILGSDWYLYRLGIKGNEKWKVPLSATAWAVNLSGDGQVVVTAQGDGTLNWYRSSDGVKLLTLFVHKDGKRWVLWSPSGYYACSPGGQDLIGWHVNNGISRAADFFSASRFQDQFYRPDVLVYLLETKDEEIALAKANEERNLGQQEQFNILANLPPIVQIHSPNMGDSFENREIELLYSLRTPQDDPVEELRIMVNGRPIDTSRGLRPVRSDDSRQSVTLHLNPGENYITLMAKNKASWSDPAIISVNCLASEDFMVKPKLYLLAIGVSDYQDNQLDLKFAAKDAQDFAAAMSSQEGGLYREVEVRLLTDANASQDQVFDGLNWIETETTDKDLAIIFVAGHGMTDSRGRLYYLTHEADIDNLRRSSVPADEFAYTIENTAGKVLYFMDTCQSGGIEVASRRSAVNNDITGLINELSSAENGAIVFASSMGSQYSLEDARWGNGAFTKALLEGLAGEADFYGNGKITVNMLDLYISERVKELTRGQQTPTTAKPDTISDFPIALK